METGAGATFDDYLCIYFTWKMFRLKKWEININVKLIQFYYVFL